LAIEAKFCTAKRTHVTVGHAKFDLNRCNEWPLRGEKPDFWPVSKFNTGSLPLCGIVPVIKTGGKLLTLQSQSTIKSTSVQSNSETECILYFTYERFYSYRYFVTYFDRVRFTIYVVSMVLYQPINTLQPTVT